MPLPTAVQVVQAVERGDLDAGVLAFENSLEGTIAGNLDQLLHETERCLIADERVLPVRFALYRAPGDDTPIRAVASHPFGLAQCSGYLAAEGYETREATSTAAACRALVEQAEPGLAAIGPDGLADRYGIVAVAEGIEDARAWTRFVLLRHSCPPPTGRDRTAIAIAPPRDEPGSLIRLLQEFSLRGINLAVIKSRPTRQELGSYVFYVECEGHLRDPDVAEAITALLRASNEVRFLGTFPADPSRPGPAAETREDPARTRYEALLRLVDP